ncbi:MAG TPA: ATP-binding protein [Pirellulales bacterium]|nr:ATP-binding protein [Pirellulales bacterium]
MQFATIWNTVDAAGVILALLAVFVPLAIWRHCRTLSALAAANLRLGMSVLEDLPLPTLVDEAVGIAAATLKVEFCELLLFTSERDKLELTAGVGWEPTALVHLPTCLETGSQAAYIMTHGEPVIIDDLRNEARFEVPDRLREHGVISGASVVIHSHDKPFGMLGVYTTRRRAFREDDVSFLQSVANALSVVVERENTKRELQEYAAELESANRELERYAAVADAATQAKSAFLANMSHEIRTPMAAILGYSELLMAGNTDLPGQQSSLYAIQRNGEHLLKLINDVLDLSKIEAGKLTVERIACSPCAVIADVASMMRVRATGKGLDFQIEYEGPVPETIHSDPTRLRQILVNLVSNSLKFTEHGGMRIVCGMATPVDAPEPKLRFDVIDTGMGMTPQVMENLFQPFTQADGSTTRKYGGTGLGLTISKRLAQALGGDIELRSAPGMGSTFTATIETGPLAATRLLDSPSEVTNTDDEQDLTTEADVATILSGRRVLLAEDGADNQYLISLHVRSAGASVELAENGRLAVEMALAAVADGWPFDLILMDMQMPELDGYRATAQLRRAGYGGPIVALTANAMSGDREKCLAHGCDGYMTKPIKKADLLRVAADHIDSQALPSAPNRAPAPVTIDTAASDAPLISSYADDPVMADAVRRFVDRLDGVLDELRLAAAANDLARLASLAHQLKGAAGGYGFDPITAAAAVLERAAKEPADATAAAGALDELLDLGRRAKTALLVPLA